jgi:hypothetical protein
MLVDISKMTKTEDAYGTSSICRLDTSTQGQYDERIVEVLRRPSELGFLKQGETKHFYSSGAFNLVQLVVYLLGQVGPCELFMATYSISVESLAVLRRIKDDGIITDIHFLIDNRVKSISPKPYAQMVASFPDRYRNCALHAKVALLWNDDWKVSVVGSQNATHNPKLERGIIHTSPQIFEFDYNRLIDEFERGTACNCTTNGLPFNIS